MAAVVVVVVVVAVVAAVVAVVVVPIAILAETLVRSQHKHKVALAMANSWKQTSKDEWNNAHANGWIDNPPNMGDNHGGAQIGAITMGMEVLTTRAPPHHHGTPPELGSSRMGHQPTRTQKPAQSKVDAGRRQRRIEQWTRTSWLSAQV